MLKIISPPVQHPYSQKSKWHSFGDKYDAIDLTRKDISDECLDWLDSVNLKPITCSMLTVFPNKTPPIVIDSPLCEQDNHARIYWVYDAPIKFTWYEVDHPLGMEHFDNLIGFKPACEENDFTSPFTGWFPKPELLVKKGERIVQPNTCILVNAGSPILAVATTPVRSKIFAVGIIKKTSNPLGSNGISFDDATKIIV